MALRTSIGHRFFLVLLLTSPTLLLRASREAQGTPPLREEAPAASSERTSGSDLNNEGVQAARSGNFEKGVALLKQGLALEPTDLQIRKNLSGVLVDWAYQLEQHGESKKGSSLLEESLAYDPENGKALLLLGEIAYHAKNDLPRAIDLWKRAYGKIPSEEARGLLQRISQAERDVAIERGFVALKTDHFQIRFEETKNSRGAIILGSILEQEYRRLVQETTLTPSLFTVIVYTDVNFKRIAGGRDWAIGLYDGRIRLRLQEIGAPWAEQVVAHELAHAFLVESYGHRIPIWVHEGFAQFCEPPQPNSPRQRSLLEGVTSRTTWVPLKWLDRRFEQPSGRDDLERAYTQAQWVVRSLIEKQGMARFQLFLKGLSAGKPVDQAFDQTFSSLSWARVDQGIFE